jgi:hypothetical protein
MPGVERKTEKKRESGDKEGAREPAGKAKE